MNYNVTDIEFDFDDEGYGYDPLTFDEEIAIREAVKKGYDLLKNGEEIPKV